MIGRSLAWLILVAGIATAAAACDRGSNDPAPPATATGAVQSTPASTSVASPSGTTVAAPTDPVVAAVAQRLRLLALQVADAPSGFTPTSDQPFSKKDATTADITIPPLAIYFNGSDLSEGLARLFTRAQPPSALTSVVYLFGTAASAKGLVDTIAALTTDGYFGATSVDRVQSDKIGDAAQMMRYETSSGRTLEYTWTQGRLAGQIVLRGGVDSPDDVAQLIALARKQSEHMAANLP